MIYFLIVVVVGGASSITGPLAAALILGIADVAGKYYVAANGRIRHLHADDRHPDRAAAGTVRETEMTDAGEATQRRRRIAEAAFWLLAFAAGVRVSALSALIGNEIAILALFALSLDLVLGYAGVVSLGHAAFFGLGAYVAGLFAPNM